MVIVCLSRGKKTSLHRLLKAVEKGKGRGPDAPKTTPREGGAGKEAPAAQAGEARPSGSHMAGRDEVYPTVKLPEKTTSSIG